MFLISKITGNQKTTLSFALRFAFKISCCLRMAFRNAPCSKTCYERWNKWKPSWKRESSFMNDIQKSWEDLSQEAVRSAILKQQEILRGIRRAKDRVAAFDYR